ncbi:hypothetical protein E2C01_005072 [Portunus trituberculatus]|uniref:Uncharacterized protein n=1 Tax=Portunus trituberculatus TaxID=210409 RepID=A0A5B7CU13_PORTR|nr:hypothetical protein [Portunus trituberculatus]
MTNSETHLHIAHRIYLECRGFLINPFSTMTHFHIQSAYYLVILYSFGNLRGD